VVISGFLYERPNDVRQEQQCVNEQHDDQNCHNSSFFICGDAAGCRQGFKGPNQEEYEQGEGEEEKDHKHCFSDVKINTEKEWEDINQWKDPDHDTHFQRGLNIFRLNLYQSGWVMTKYLQLKIDTQTSLFRNSRNILI